MNDRDTAQKIADDICKGGYFTDTSEFISKHFGLKVLNEAIDAVEVQGSATYFVHKYISDEFYMRFEGPKVTASVHTDHGEFEAYGTHPARVLMVAAFRAYKENFPEEELASGKWLPIEKAPMGQRVLVRYFNPRTNREEEYVTHKDPVVGWLMHGHPEPQKFMLIPE